jgi:hypothetical protein
MAAGRHSGLPLTKEERRKAIARAYDRTSSLPLRVVVSKTY